MQTRVKFFTIFVAILAIAATLNAQTETETFYPNGKGEVYPINVSIFSLMEKADKTALVLKEAEKKFIQVEKRLERVLADKKSGWEQIFEANTDYILSYSDMAMVRISVGGEIYDAINAYYERSRTISEAGLKTAPNEFAAWEKRILSSTKFNEKTLSRLETLTEKSARVMKAVEKKEDEAFRRLYGEPLEEREKKKGK